MIFTFDDFLTTLSLADLRNLVATSDSTTISGTKSINIKKITQRMVNEAHG